MLTPYSRSGLDPSKQSGSIFKNSITIYHLQGFSETVKKTTDPDKKKMQEGQLSRLTACVASVEASVRKAGSKEELDSARDELLAASKDLLSDWLDREKGAGVTDNAIFSALPRYWEDQFHKDMEALNVRN